MYRSYYCAGGFDQGPHHSFIYGTLLNGSMHVGVCTYDYDMGMGARREVTSPFASPTHGRASTINRLSIDNRRMHVCSDRPGWRPENELELDTSAGCHVRTSCGADLEEERASTRWSSRKDYRLQQQSKRPTDLAPDLARTNAGKLGVIDEFVNMHAWSLAAANGRCHTFLRHRAISACMHGAKVLKAR